MTLSSGTLSRWYLQLAAGLEAGLSFDRALSAASGLPPVAQEAIRQRIVAGSPIEEALEGAADALPEMDRQLMATAAQAGRLPEMLRRLSARLESTAGASRSALLLVLYPVFVVHFAIVVLPINTLIQGPGLLAYLGMVFRILIPLWIVGAVAIVAMRRRWRWAAAALACVPFLRGYRRFRALADLAFVLEAQLLAGVRLDAAWRSAADAVGDPRLRLLAHEVQATVIRGSAVGPVLEQHRGLPAPFATFYANGEQTGRLDESLQYLQRHFADRASTRLKVATLVYPNVVFVGIAVWIAVKVIGFWLGYFNQFEQLQ